MMKPVNSETIQKFLGWSYSWEGSLVLCIKLQSMLDPGSHTDTCSLKVARKERRWKRLVIFCLIRKLRAL